MKQLAALAGARSVIVGIAAALAASAMWIVNVSAQSDPDAQALRQMRVGHSVPVETDVVVGVRTFEPGNRTYWHSHAGGFILFVQEGKARVQTRGGPMRELGPGEIDYTPPGVEHWHGAAPDERLLQLGVVPLGGGIEFTAPVTDAEYDGVAL
jgi:quercetin dioxygenase-like cupin family protein